MEGSKAQKKKKKWSGLICLEQRATGEDERKQKLTYHLVQGRHRVRSTLSAVAVLRLVKVAALVIHAAALELAEEVEEAVFIGGVAAQFLV